MRGERGETPSGGRRPKLNRTPSRVLLRERCLARARYCLDVAALTHNEPQRRVLKALSRSYTVMAGCLGEAGQPPWQ